MAGIFQTLLGSLAGVAKDTFFKYVTLLLPGNGANGAQNNTFLDASTNNFTITRNGNTTQGTFTPFGSNWSNYFDGTGDYFTFTKQTTATDFTCECWFFRGENVTGSHQLFGGSNASSPNPDNVQLGVSNTGGVFLALNGVVVIAATGTAVTKYQWSHIAWVRSGTDCAIFVDGSRIATGTSSAALNVDRIATVGGVTGNDANGYISNARINTTAVYDPSLTTCTVPAAPLSAITGTYLLTCQSNRFVDNSASPLTLTLAGSPSVQRFSPFSPTDAYSTSVVGGSGYFDGTGDYLSVANAATLTPSGDFTIEFWAYPITGGVREYYSKGYGIQIYTSGGSWGAAFSSNNTSGYYVATSFGASVTNAWQHIAVYRSGNNYYGALNGVVTLLGTSSNSPDTGTDPVWIGDFSVFGGYPVTGYLSNVRYVNGTAVYGASNFTPSTTPLTAITNTQLLLNFSNAGIIDNAMLNDLETVGNAQISTAQSKFGGSSILFDGTGDWLAIPSTQNFTFGTGDFTIEFWIYTANNGNLMNPATSTGTGYWGLLIQSGELKWNSAYNVTNLWAVTATSIQNSAWHHVAIARASGTTKVFFDGVSQSAASGTFTDPTNYSGVDGWKIGSGNLADFNGYIDDLRITKGYARYTADFTPPAQAFPTS